MAATSPTSQSMKDYLKLWQMTRDKGAVFADSWRHVVWQNPSLNHTRKQPINNSVIEIYDGDRIQNEEQQLKMLAKERGLISFSRSDCPYCHAMAPTLEMFSDKYGIRVLSVPVDDVGPSEFPNPRDGRAQVAAWGIECVPALFTGSKQTDDRVPVGFGMMALTETVS